jgi:hypothetical protein
MHAVVASKAALTAILTARGAWAAVDIRPGQPSKREDITRDIFWYEPTEIPEDAWAAGGLTRGLTFLLGFSITVIRDGDSELTTENACWALVEDLMAALKANPTLSGTIMKAGTVTGKQGNDPMPNQCWSVFTGSIECQSNFY